MKRTPLLLGCSFVLFAGSGLLAQRCGDGRIFNTTIDTIGLWEFNDLGAEGSAPAGGTIIPDLSGNGLDAIVEAQNGSVVVGPGNPDFGFPDDDPPVFNRSVGRISGGSARIAVPNDRGVFEMAEDQDFSLELFIYRAEVEGGENWGVLAGTMHTRNTIDDGVDPTAQGVWYGYGFFRDNAGTWQFTVCPVNPDGSPLRVGNNERNTTKFAIDPGFHYLVAVVDREVGEIRVYLDGDQVASGPVQPDWALLTPPGHDPARMLFLNGEDDASRNFYRPPPSGYYIDAARFQAAALSADDVLDNWLGIQDAVAVPEGEESDVEVVLQASRLRVLVGECVRLDAAASCSRSGAIASYEWRVGGGEFEAGEAVNELAFDAPSDESGVPVTVRVTGEGGASREATVRVVVETPQPVIALEARFAGLETALDDELFVPQGTLLTLDASATSTPVRDGALACPLDAGNAVPAPGNAGFRWDIDGDGVADLTSAVVELGPLDDAGTSLVSLTVVNDLGGEATRELRIEVTSRGRASEVVFHDTDATIVRFEFNSFEGDTLGEEVADGTVIPDLSGNGYAAVVENNTGQGTLVLGAGDPAYNDPPRDPDPERRNTALRRANLLEGPGAAINDDDDVFEFAEFDDFTVELYVTRDEVVEPSQWGLLAGTWHSRTLLDDSLADQANANGAWYGWGFIMVDNGPGFTWIMSPVTSAGGLLGSGMNGLSFNERDVRGQPFEIPPGSHYIVASVDRIEQEARIYLDGQRVARLALNFNWAFMTPPGYEKARFVFLSGVDDASRNQYRPAPSGYAIDAARIQAAALSDAEVAENWQSIGAGAGADAPPAVTRPFKRGDVDGNGTLELTDPINNLVFQFLADFTPSCLDALDFDDNGSIEVTDPVASLARQFLGQAPAPPPGSDACGDDPTPDDLDCASYSGCP